MADNRRMLNVLDLIHEESVRRPRPERPTPDPPPKIYPSRLGPMLSHVGETQPEQQSCRYCGRVYRSDVPEVCRGCGAPIE